MRQPPQCTHMSGYTHAHTHTDTISNTHDTAFWETFYTLSNSSCPNCRIYEYTFHTQWNEIENKIKEWWHWSFKKHYINTLYIDPWKCFQMKWVCFDVRGPESFLQLKEPQAEWRLDFCHSTVWCKGPPLHWHRWIWDTHPVPLIVRFPVPLVATTVPILPRL